MSPPEPSLWSAFSVWTWVNLAGIILVTFGVVWRLLLTILKPPPNPYAIYSTNDPKAILPIELFFGKEAWELKESKRVRRRRSAEIMAISISLFGAFLNVIVFAPSLYSSWMKTESLRSNSLTQTKEIELLRSNNFAFRTNVVALETAVRELAHLYDQGTNALAEANARVSVAMKKAEEAGPRRLTEDKKILMASFLTNAPKVQFNFELNENVPDTEGLFQDLLPVLMRSGFRFCNSSWSGTTGGRVIGIWVSASTNPVVTDAILKSLNAVGLNAWSGPHPHVGSIRRGGEGGLRGLVPCDGSETITIEIGHKPP